MSTNNYDDKRKHEVETQAQHCEVPKEPVCEPCHTPPPVCQPQCDGDFNSNSNSNSNSNANCNVNANWNTTNVDVCVDVKVDASLCATPSAADIDLSGLNVCDNTGIVNIMPEDSYQVINAGGESCDPSALANNVIFHLDQVNNLINNNTATATNSGYSNIGNFGSVTGGATNNNTGALTSSENTQSLDHAGSVNVDGITQSITAGANIQINTSTFTGHDSVVADHGATAHHDAVAAG